MRKLKVYELKLDEKWKVEINKEVERIGVLNFAKELGVSDVTVQQWLFSGKREPRLSHKGKLHYYFKSKGVELKFDEIPEVNSWQEKLFKVFLEKGFALLAKDLGVSKYTIYYWITEKKYPSDEHYDVVISYLDKQKKI